MKYHFSPIKPLACALFVSASLSTSALSFAHGDLHTQIDEVTTEIVHMGNAADPQSLNEKADLFTRRGRLYIEHKEYDNAKDDFVKALELNRKNANAHYFLGEIALRQGDNLRAQSEAETFLNMLENDAPGEMRGNHLKAMALMGLRNYEDAANALEKTIRTSVKPKPDYYLDLATCYSEVGSTNKAITALESGTNKLGDLPVFTDKLIEIYRADHNVDAALNLIDTQVAKGIRKPFLLVEKTALLLENQRVMEAQNAINEARDAVYELPAARQNSPALRALKDRMNALEKRTTP